ncbi:MAG: GNAT family N-acetyltransferase [Antricoccus sp.]
MADYRIQRLTRKDLEVARKVFAMMADVFGEDDEGPVTEPLTDQYLDRILDRDSFWALAAFDDGDVVGGLTAHTLPMTRSTESELFIYDLAVRQDQQRRGVGSELIRAARSRAAAEGIDVVFVPADDDDTHALEFYRAQGGAESAVTHFTFETI